MQKIKEFSKKYLIGLSLSFLICISAVSAITYFDSKNVTYDNSVTGMASTNVQDAVNELYNVCTAEKVDVGGKEVITTTTGDGLYKDTYEEGRYFYKGKNVNNYITFNNEVWRIVSIEPDKTIKIMREANLGDRAWDSSGSYGNNNWARPADLNTYLNGSYLTDTLNSTAQSQIVPKDWSIGSVTYDNNDLADQINDEKTTTWNGKVALITMSEYLRSNSNQSSCGTYASNNDNSSSCKNTTWMYINDDWWTLSPLAGNSYTVFSVYSSGVVGLYNASTTFSAVRPAVYLSSSVQITGGNGSSETPYQIK